MNPATTATALLASTARSMRVPILFTLATLLILMESSRLMAQENQPSAEELIQTLGLEGHVEGGYYRRTYEASNQARISTDDGDRFRMTSIFYLLTAGGPVGHFHRNRSDIVHYFHLGDPIEYVLIHPDGELQTVTMGPDPRKGHHLQLTVAGGVWKASRLNGEGKQGYGLISEAVSPGFDYRDMTLGITSQLLMDFPQHRSYIEALSRESAPQR